MNGRETVGISGLRRSAPLPGRNGPGDRNPATMERRKALPRPLLSGDPDTPAAALPPKSRLRRFISSFLREAHRDCHLTRTGAGKDGSRLSLTCITAINNIITGGHSLPWSPTSTESHASARPSHPTNSTLRQQTLAAFRLLSPLPSDAVACLVDSAFRHIRHGGEQADNKKQRVCDPERALGSPRRSGARRQSSVRHDEGFVRAVSVIAVMAACA